MWFDNFRARLAKRRRRETLRQRVEELEVENLELKKQLKGPPLPKIPLLSMPSKTALQEMSDLDLMYPTLMDYGKPYYYTTAEGWAAVFEYIYQIFDMPPYMVARMDCEDFAILLKGLVSALFGLNYFAIVIGKNARGKYHAFNIYRDEIERLVFEPQTAVSSEIGENGFTPKYTLL